jgi:hypothetical protein
MTPYLTWRLQRTRLVERVDRALAELGPRELVSSAEVADLLLDLRNLAAPDPMAS